MFDGPVADVPITRSSKRNSTHSSTAKSKRKDGLQRYKREDSLDVVPHGIRKEVLELRENLR